MPKQRLILLLPLLLFLGLILLFWRGLMLHPHLLPSTFIDKPVPYFTLPELFHPQKNFSSTQLKGQITLLNVWATWCANCRLEHPILMDISEHQHIPIYGINYKDSRPQAIAWLKQYGNPYQAVGFDATGQAAITLGVYGTPETFIIDSHGIIRYKHIGPITSDVWHEEILPELNTLKIKK